ncbi:Rho termination factor N-terminal domain-containing protein [Bradyrhizobium sp.]|jgi:hypothetical protein|uniref:Rho termination factor N-terminal domain-containing protein n=1 Tax=Bradyrhizobium sp. TaxID=376 RepID=UPI00391C461B
MCDDQQLTLQQVLSRLDRPVREFYRRHLPPRNRAQDLRLKSRDELVWLAMGIGVENPSTMDQEELLAVILKRFSTLEKDLIVKSAADCASTFWVHLYDYLDDVAEWSKEPSRMDVIKELNQVAAYLLDNLEVQADQPLNPRKLDGLERLTTRACKELVHRTSDALAVMAPDRGTEQQDQTQLSQFRMFGWNSAENDVHRMKRAFTAAARDPSINMHGLKQLYDRLHPETSQRLTVASNGFEEPVPIAPFVTTMDRAARENLALCLKLAARDLETAFGLWNRTTDPRRHKPVTDFEKPAPLYQFVMALLEQGWPCFRAAVNENERLMEGDTDTDCFEKVFSKLVAEIVRYAPRLFQEGCRRDDFDPLVGINAAIIFKDADPPARSDRAAWQVWAVDVAGRLATRIARAREQIVILRDYAETTRRLSDELFVRARRDGSLGSDGHYFNAQAKNEIIAWCRECERQYRHGIFYLEDRKNSFYDQDRKRKEDDYFEVKLLGVDLWRHEYPRRHQGGSRFADVPVEKTRAILERLHSAGPIREQLARILSRLEN